MTEKDPLKDIELLIRSRYCIIFLDTAEFSTQILLKELSLTRPLSVTMGERIAQLRSWARERTVSAQ